MSEPGSHQRWEARYETAPLWSGKVNSSLRDWATTHRPRQGDRALDLACGEGGDAIWLAHEGWGVTGVDFSEAAITRAKGAASAQGLEVTWLVAELGTWTPPSSFELVLLSFFHEASDVRHAAWKTAGRAVAQGGTLLITGHAADPNPDAPGPAAHTRFELAEVLDVMGDGWVHTYQELHREATGRHAGHILTDVVVELSRVDAKSAVSGYGERSEQGGTMSDEENTVSRRAVFEEIRANELARGASEDEAARIAAERVDQVVELKKAK